MRISPESRESTARPTLALPGSVDYTQGDGESDGEVAMFAFRTSGAVNFGSTTGKYPLSMTTAIAGSVVPNIAGHNGRYVVTASSAPVGILDWKQVGCPPAL